MASRKQKTFPDSKFRHELYKVVDLVWLNDPTESHRKLAHHWKVPYLVQRKTDRDDEVGVTYQIRSPFGEEPPFQTVHYDGLRRYNLPVVFTLEGHLEAPSPLPHPLLCGGDSATPSSPVGISLFDKDVNCDGRPVPGVGVAPEQAVALPRFSRVGRSSRLPTLGTM